jgi:outer membrane beta-barrel protein
MEGRLRILLLIAGALALGGCSMWPFHRKPAAEPDPVEVSRADGTVPAVVEPTVVRRTVKTPKIKSSNFEVGVDAGTYSVEDFGVSSTFDARLAYHISEKFFAEAMVGTARAGLSSYEILSGGANLLTPAQRRLTYYDLALGYDVLPGEVFLGHHAFNSALYVLGGVGSTHFAGGDHFTVMPGVGYRMLLNNWVAMHVDVRDQIFDLDLLGYTKTNHNLETTLGFSVYF